MEGQRKRINKIRSIYTPMSDCRKEYLVVSQVGKELDSIMAAMMMTMTISRKEQDPQTSIYRKTEKCVGLPDGKEDEE